jgi:hypothetical protein
MKHNAMKRIGKWRYSLFIAAVSGQLHALAASPGEGDAGTNCTGGWVGPSAGLDVTEKRNDSYVYRLKVSTSTHNDIKTAVYILNGWFSFR